MLETVTVTGSIWEGTQRRQIWPLRSILIWYRGASAQEQLSCKKNPKPQQPDNSTTPKIVLFLCVFSNCKTSNRDRIFTGFICLCCLTADLI